MPKKQNATLAADGKTHALADGACIVTYATRDGTRCLIFLLHLSQHVLKLSLLHAQQNIFIIHTPVPFKMNHISTAHKFHSSHCKRVPVTSCHALSHHQVHISKTFGSIDAAFIWKLHYCSHSSSRTVGRQRRQISTLKSRPIALDIAFKYRQQKCAWGFEPRGRIESANK